MRTKLYIVAALLITGCSKQINTGNNQQPFDNLSSAIVFSSENNMQLYVNSFYKILPKANDIVRGDNIADNIARIAIPEYLVPSAYDSKNSGGWNWQNLRNVNYFIVNAPKAASTAGVDQEVVNHYLGIAKFFRAWIYFDKVKRFGDVPWYSKPLDPSDEDLLYKPRDARQTIMDSVLSDLNFACQNIKQTKDRTCSQITKWVALAFKSRVCLFEGSFRKYHSELNLQSSSEKWFSEAVNASREIIESGEYLIHTNSSNARLSYRDLFVNQSGNPPVDEAILSANCSSTLSIFNDANWYYVSSTYGACLNLTKTFVNTYLNIDGTRFTDNANYNSLPFQQEVKNRDLRLQQTIRMGDYKRSDGSAAPPNFSYSSTGYHPIKYTLDSKVTDGVARNDNSIPILRYAEVLLNYAEAKAELGQFTEDDWNKTIKPLRQRAGIQNTSFPVTADGYLTATYFPEISDPGLLEIRRERSIELVLEGFRFDDLLRWKKGDLLEKPWEGLYVPAINVAYDLNEDGANDVAFVSELPANKEPGVVYVIVVNNNTIRLSENTKGNLLWRSDETKEWKDYKYYYPIPFEEMVLNPNLNQNPGWQ